ncbi:MAG: ATP-binding protein [Frankia sp.]
MAEALTARFDLPADFRAAARARRIVTELLAAWGRPEDAEVARLLVSEVVTNAVRHAGQSRPLELTVTADHGRIRVAVGDGSNRYPVPRTAHDDEESGRGMHLVASLASEWGVGPPVGPGGEVGKEVWFELPAPNGDTPTDSASRRLRVPVGLGVPGDPPGQPPSASVEPATSASDEVAAPDDRATPNGPADRA